MSQDISEDGGVKGTAYIELRIGGRYVLSDATGEWSEEEKQRLLAGDPEAKRELEDQLISALCFQPHNLETECFELNLESS